MSKKRVLAGLMSAMLCVGSLTAFAEAQDPMAKYPETVKLTSCKSVSDQMQTFIDKKSDVLTDNIWFNSYRDELGIEVEYAWTAPSAQYEEKMNAQIAANDLPDFMQVNANQLKQLVDYGMAYDMTEVFEQYATPFTREMMEADMNVGLTQATFDGKLFALPNVNGNRDGSNFWWIRYDWLEKLNLEEPKTLDDLVKVMYAFTQNDPDGNGQNDTFGMGLTKELLGGNIGLAALGDGMGAYMDGWINGESGIEYGSIQPQVKEMLKLVNKLYADGVLDREFIVKDATKVNEDIISGKIGMFGGQHWQAFYPLQDAKNANPDADWRAISIVSNDGSTPKTMLNGSAANFYAVNVDCKNPEAVVKLYNYYYKKDPALSPDFDLHYHGRLDGEPDSEVTEWYNWAAVNSFYPMQNLFIHRGVEKFFDEGDESMKENYWVADNIASNEKYKAGDNSYWSSFGWSGAGDYSGEGRIDYYDQNDMFIQNAYIGANTDSMVQYNATLGQLRLDTFTRIITGDAPIDEFDNYVEQWKALGGDMITQEVNAK
jgi:putative aldouronate transport system substrate-binding protein